jgi:hypothetical protein
MKPQIVTNGDTARTRRTDPITSHIAGDTSQRTLKDVRNAVAWLFTQVDTATGGGMNELYRELRAEHGWPDCHFDSPRKRTGEMYDDGELVLVDEGHGRNPERVFALRSKEQAA